MTLYRPHRGMLADAMKEAVEVADFDALIAHMRALVAGFYPEDQMPTAENTTVEPYGGFDARIGWHTHIVLVSTSAGSSQVWGFTNGPMEPESK